MVNSVDVPEELRRRMTWVQARESKLQIDSIIEDLPSLFGETKRGFDRIDRIIQSMRRFSHVDRDEEFIPFCINKAVENTLVIARNSYKYCADVHKELGCVPDALCLPEQIHQVILNLIINAAHAIKSQNRPDKGVIRVCTGKDGDFVFCRVSDDGPGIGPQNRTRIFDAFFSTKPQGEGSGLGLSISYDIVVNKHKGMLSADCPQSGGTEFTMQIPIGFSNPG